MVRALTAETGVRLRYLNRSPVRVTGSVTGRVYQFSAVTPEQLVAPDDTHALLSTGLFRRA